jgi:hypothetical protein
MRTWLRWLTQPSIYLTLLTPTNHPHPSNDVDNNHHGSPGGKTPCATHLRATLHNHGPVMD